MSLPEKPRSDPQSKTAKPHQSGSHPLKGSSAASRPQLPKMTKVGPGQSWANLMRGDVEEYARSHAAAPAGASPGPRLLQKVSDGFKGLLKKLIKTP